MQTTISRRDQISVVAAVGRIDAMTAEAFASALHQEIARGNIRLIVDLTAVDYVSSAGVHAITTALRESRKQSGDVRIAGAQKEVRKVFALSGLTSVAEFFSDVDAACASFAEKDS